MRGRFSLMSRKSILAMAAVLAVGAIAVAVLAFQAANVEQPDRVAPIAAQATETATRAALAVEERLLDVGELLASLAAKGGASSKSRKAMNLAHRSFRKTDGLEQLAVYGPDGRTRWVMRPAGLGGMIFPKDAEFVAGHLLQPELQIRLGASFKADGPTAWWTPVTYYLKGDTPAASAVFVAFLRADKLQAILKQSAGDASLFTDGGVLAQAFPPAPDALGGSFGQTDSFKAIDAAPGANGSFVSATAAGPASPYIVGFSKLACCGAFVTSALPGPAPEPVDPIPLGRWLTLAAASLMIVLAMSLILRLMVRATPDPWRDFGKNRDQAAA